MSEDTSTKSGNRRRRTTRAGRRRGLRVPSERSVPEAEAGWTPAWTSEAPPTTSELETLPGEALEEIEAEADVEVSVVNDERVTTPDEDDRVTTPTRDAVVARAARSEPAEAASVQAARDDDIRATAEIVVTPLRLSELQEEEKTLPRRLSELLQDEEKTNPRIRISELTADPAYSSPRPTSDRPSGSWRRLGDAGTGAELDESAQLTRPSVVIAPARVISDHPPAMRSAPEPESALIARAGVAAVAPAQRLQPSDPAPARTVAEAVAEQPVLAAEPEALAAEPEALAAEPEALAAEPEALAAEPEAAPPAALAPAESSSAPERADAVAATGSTADAAAGTEPAEDAGLQLVDVDVSEFDAERRSRTPPPPPPDARGKTAAPKRPPPPPAKSEDDRGKRKQVRQWWERFFSDDYLMSVLSPTPAQIAKQVDFMEQSLAVPKGGTILDVGCGLGLHSVELSRRGYLVVGLDLSLAMITRAAEFAQHEQLKLNVVHADIREMEFDGAFDGIVCWGTTFGFFDEEANRDVLARLHHALRPGGRVLLDTVNRDYVIRFQPNLVWFEGDECVCMEESDFNYFSSRLTVKRTIMREDGRQSQAEYSVRLYSLHELGQLMQQVGFRVIEVSGQEAIRGTFFGGHSPRVLMLSERRSAGRASTAVPPERGSAEAGRASMVMPPERGSSEVPKIPKPE